MNQVLAISLIHREEKKTQKYQPFRSKGLPLRDTVVINITLVFVTNSIELVMLGCNLRDLVQLKLSTRVTNLWVLS